MWVFFVVVVVLFKVEVPLPWIKEGGERKKKREEEERENFWVCFLVLLVDFV